MLTNIFKNAGNSTGKTIFVIEDDAMYGKTLKSFLQNSFPGLRDIKVFQTGEMALEQLHLDPSVVIIDYFLNSQHPHAGNGLEIIRQVRSRRPGVNIIVLSSQDRPGVIIEAIMKYDCRYIQKDKDAFQHLEQLIKSFLLQSSTLAKA